MKNYIRRLSSECKEDMLKLQMSWIDFVPLFLISIMVAVGFWMSTQISISLVDDIWCSLFLGPSSDVGFFEYVWGVLTDPMAGRFRWFFDFKMSLLWNLFATNLGLLHAIEYLIRIIICALSVYCLCIVEKPTSVLVCIAPVIYGFFSPIVPESRLCLQEPIQSLMMIACMSWICRLLVINNGNLSDTSYFSRFGFTLIFICLSGSKETSFLYMTAFLVPLIWCQFKYKKFQFLFTGVLLITLLITLWRVWVIFSSPEGYGYQQAEGGGFNLGWLFYIMRTTILDRILMFWGERPLLAVLVLVVFLLVPVKVYRSFKDSEMIGKQCARLFVILFGFISLLFVAKLQLVMRYMEPAMWIVSIIFGIGLSCFDHKLKALYPKICMYIFLLLIALGNYPKFLWHFAAQANVRNNEARLLAYISNVYDKYPSANVYIFGWDEKSEWMAVRRIEQAIQIKHYFEYFRPKYLDQTSHSIIPIEKAPEGIIANGRLLISKSNDEVIRENSEMNYTLYKVAEFAPQRHTPAVDVYLWIKRVLSQSGLWNGSVKRWRDAGSPGGLYNDRWYIYKILQVDSKDT